MSQREFNMTHGAYTGLGMSSVVIIYYLMGNLFSPGTEYAVGFVLFVSLAYFLLKYKNAFKEEVSYMVFLKVGSSISFWASVMLAFAYFILMNLVDTGLYEEYLQFLKEGLEQTKMNMPEDIDLIEEMRINGSPNMVAFQKFLGKTLLGIFFSSLISLISLTDFNIKSK